MGTVPESDNFFGTLKNVFNLFGSLLNSWEELKIESFAESLTLKKLYVTRWASRIDSVCAVLDRYPHIMTVLTHITLTSKTKMSEVMQRDSKKRWILMNWFFLLLFAAQLLVNCNPQQLT